jgi:hypothetical protein
LLVVQVLIHIMATTTNAEKVLRACIPENADSKNIKAFLEEHPKYMEFGDDLIRDFESWTAACRLKKTKDRQDVLTFAELVEQSDTKDVRELDLTNENTSLEDESWVLDDFINVLDAFKKNKIMDKIKSLVAEI